MANLGMLVDVNDIPEREAFEPVPPGDYTAMITESEMKATKDNLGEMLVLTVELQDGNGGSRKLFERLNLKNKNETAVKIAFQTLGEIIKAVGKTSIKDSEELHNKRLTVTVVVDPAKPYMKDGVQQPGSPQNRIKKYAPYGALDNTAGVAQAAPASGDNLPPWKRKA